MSTAGAAYILENGVATSHVGSLGPDSKGVLPSNGVWPMGPSTTDGVYWCVGNITLKSDLLDKSAYIGFIYKNVSGDMRFGIYWSGAHADRSALVYFDELTAGTGGATGYDPCVITYNYNDGSDDESFATITVPKNSVLGMSLLFRPTRDGYNFGYWSAGAQYGTTPITAAKPTITEDMTIYVQWVPTDTYVVIFDPMDCRPGAQRFPDQTPIIRTVVAPRTTLLPQGNDNGWPEQPNNPNGGSNKGWYPTTDFSGYSGPRFESNTVVTQSIIVYMNSYINK
jgi:hypothetical protein